jgi:cystathionine beta-lyase/cystathionine gamma-synthase
MSPYADYDKKHQEQLMTPTTAEPKTHRLNLSDRTSAGITVAFSFFMSSWANSFGRHLAISHVASSAEP